MAKTLRLWVDVPASERMTAEDWATCHGANDPQWLEGRISRYVEGNGVMCSAAVRMESWEDEKWHPCGMVTADGEEFCPSHGGPRKRWDVPRKPWVELERARLERRKQTILSKIDRLQLDAKDIDRSLEALSAQSLISSTVTE